MDLVGAALDDAAARAGLDATPTPLRAAAPPARPATRLTLLPDDSEQAHLMIGVPAPSRHDPRRPALAVLSTALGGGPSSRLFQQVREERGLAYSVYSATAGYADAGSLAVYAGCGPERLGEVATVKAAAPAVLAVPSCQRSPGRSDSVSVRPLSLHAQRRA